VTTELVTERLILEPFTVTSARVILAAPRQPDWIEGFPTGGERRIGETLVRGDRVLAPWPFGVFLIRERSSALLVGGCGFHGAPRERSVEMGYGLAEAAWGLGYATEACRRLLVEAFASGDVDQVTATIDETNVKSRNVLERCGFSRVGRSATNWSIDAN
jgi:RimJ/RimL family protein N-acetyltransferase